MRLCAFRSEDFSIKHGDGKSQYTIFHCQVWIPGGILVRIYYILTRCPFRLDKLTTCSVHAFSTQGLCKALKIRNRGERSPYMTFLCFRTLVNMVHDGTYYLYTHVCIMNTYRSYPFNLKSYFFVKSSFSFYQGVWQNLEPNNSIPTYSIAWAARFCQSLIQAVAKVFSKSSATHFPRWLRACSFSNPHIHYLVVN